MQHPTGRNLTTFCIHFDNIHVIIWQYSGYISTTFWIHFDSILDTFWQHSGCFDCYFAARNGKNVATFKPYFRISKSSSESYTKHGWTKGFNKCLWWLSFFKKEVHLMVRLIHFIFSFYLESSTFSLLGREMRDQSRFLALL